PRAAGERWREVRDGLFRDHPQSARPGFEGLDYFDYEPAWRFAAQVVPVEPDSRKIAGSGPEPVAATRFAVARFDGGELELFWLGAYGGGLFLPFRGATSGGATFAGGGHLLAAGTGAQRGEGGGRTWRSA